MLCQNKFKEYKEQKEQYKEDEEDLDYFRRALTDVLHNAQDDQSVEEDEEQQDNEDEQEQEAEENTEQRNYHYMLMAMANHMLSEKMEKEQLEEAIKLSLNQN